MKIYSGRFFVSFVCLFLSSLAIMASFKLTAGGFLALIGQSPRATSTGFLYWSTCIAPTFSWVALGVMTRGWIFDKRVHWLWLLFGSIAGLYSAALLFVFFFFYMSSVFLACYLVYYHFPARRQLKLNAG